MKDPPSRYTFRVAFYGPFLPKNAKGRPRTLLDTRFANNSLSYPFYFTSIPMIATLRGMVLRQYIEIVLFSPHLKVPKVFVKGTINVPFTTNCLRKFHSKCIKPNLICILMSTNILFKRHFWHEIVRAWQIECTTLCMLPSKCSSGYLCECHVTDSVQSGTPVWVTLCNCKQLSKAFKSAYVFTQPAGHQRTKGTTEKGKAYKTRQ